MGRNGDVTTIRERRKAAPWEDGNGHPANRLTTSTTQRAHLALQSVVIPTNIRPHIGRTLKYHQVTNHVVWADLNLSVVAAIAIWVDEDLDHLLRPLMVITLGQRVPRRRIDGIKTYK